MASKKFVAATHVFLNLIQVAVAVLFVKLDLLPLAILMALAGKWRIFSFNYHRLWRNLKANSCDLIVLISAVLLIDFYRSSLVLLSGVAIFLATWLTVIKPATSRGAVALQATCCHFLGLTALWLVGVERDWSGFVVLPLVAVIAYSSTRHLGVPFEDSDEPRERSIIPVLWAVIMVQLAWLSWLWSITYRLPGEILIPQLALIGTGLGYFAVHHMYIYLDQRRRLPAGFIWQQVLFCLIVVVAIIVLTPWSTR